MKEAQHNKLQEVQHLQQTQLAASERITDLSSRGANEAQHDEALAAYAKTVEQLVELLGPEAHCSRVDADLWSQYSDLFKSVEGLRPPHHVTREQAKAWLSAQTMCYSGYMAFAGERLQVDFAAPYGASTEALDAAFLNTLAQQVTIEYLRVG